MEKSHTPESPAVAADKASDRCEEKPFESLMLEYMPWHKGFKENPDSYISFNDIADAFSLKHQQVIWNNFVLGKIDAFNLLTGYEACSFFTLSPAVGAFDYIQGGFPAHYQGELEFESIPDEVLQFGEFDFHPRWSSTPPHWSFKLHQHIRSIPTSLSKGVRILKIGYKRIGASSTPKSILLYFDSKENGEIVISALCENRFYRGLNKKLMNLSKSFVARNFEARASQDHVLVEEVAFYAASLVTSKFSTAAVPEDQIANQREAIAQINQLKAHLVFLRKDVQNTDVENNFIPGMYNDHSVEKTRTGYPQSSIQEEHKAGSGTSEQQSTADQAEGPYIFKKRERGGWKIQYENEIIEIHKSRGCIFIHAILKNPDGYTPYELEDLFDSSHLPTEDIHNTDTPQQKPVLKSNRGKDHEERLSDQRKLKDYNMTIKKEEERRDEIEKLLSDDTQPPDQVMELKEELDKIRKRLSIYKEEAVNTARGRGASNPESKKKSQRVDKAIKDAQIAIAKKSPQIGLFFSNYIQKVKATENKGRIKKWKYINESLPWQTE